MLFAICKNKVIAVQRTAETQDYQMIAFQTASYYTERKQ